MYVVDKTVELKISFITSNYPMNLLIRQFLELQSKLKLKLASHQIVYVEIKFYYNKFVKSAQRLAKIINNYYKVVKVVPYFNTERF